MNTCNASRRWLAALAMYAFAACALAQAQTKEEFQPEVGQPGKDVVWVPSPQQLVDRMLNMAKVTAQDFVMDLGSGDGRTVITAAQRGARAIGVEFNPAMVALSRSNAEKAGVAGKASFVEGDIFKTDLSRATVITLFLLTDLNIRLRPKLLALKPGTRVASNTFRMGEWEPDETAEVGCDGYCTAYLWIVPARVQGKWKLPQGELTLRQTFQKVTGTLRSGGEILPISAGRLTGNQISFSAGDAKYQGRVTGKTIEGTLDRGTGTEPWRMTRQ